MEELKLIRRENALIFKAQQMANGVIFEIYGGVVVRYGNVLPK